MYVNSKTKFIEYKKYTSKTSLSTLNLIYLLKVVLINSFVCIFTMHIMYILYTHSFMLYIFYMICFKHETFLRGSSWYNYNV